MEHLFILFGTVPFEQRQQLGIFSTFKKAQDAMMENLKEFEDNGMERFEINKQKIDELTDFNQYGVSNYYEIELLRELL